MTIQTIKMLCITDLTKEAEEIYHFSAPYHPHMTMIGQRILMILTAKTDFRHQSTDTGGDREAGVCWQKDVYFNPNTGATLIIKHELTQTITDTKIIEDGLTNVTEMLKPLMITDEERRMRLNEFMEGFDPKQFDVKKDGYLQ